MNTGILIEKLKSKLNESSDVIDNTLNNQKLLLSSSQEVNKTIRDFIEEDIKEKTTFREINEKVIKTKLKIESSKSNIKLAKDKLKVIKLKLEKFY